MRIIYPNPNPLPGDDPAAIQVVQAVAALGQFAEVHLIAHNGDTDKVSLDAINHDSLRQFISDYYGIRLPNSVFIHLLPPSQLHLGPIKIRSNKIFHKRVMNRIRQINREFGESDAVLTRSLKHGVYLLHNKKKLRISNVIYESHDISLLVLQDRITAGAKLQRDELLRTEKAEKYVYRNADGLIFTTHNMERIARELYNSVDKTLVAPNGINISDIVIPEADNDKGRQILYIGSLHHWKGIDILIQAMTYIPDASLIIVGGNPVRIEGHRNAAESLGVADRVFFKGQVPPSERFNWISSADICVLPLRYSNMGSYLTSPLKLFEYMSARKPIVVSDLPSIREIITDGVNGVLCEPENPESLAGGIRLILDDPAFGKRIGDQAGIDVQKYTWEKRAESIIGFIGGL
ncbi:MAG: glycosyltransferase family 4 protein [Armatimonadota bacterium]